MNRTKVPPKSGDRFPRKSSTLPSSFYIPNNHVPEAEIARKLHFIMKTECRAQISFVSHRQFTGYFFVSSNQLQQPSDDTTAPPPFSIHFCGATCEQRGPLILLVIFFGDEILPSSIWIISGIEAPCDSPPTHGTQPSYLACCTMDLAAGQALYLHLST